MEAGSFGVFEWKKAISYDCSSVPDRDLQKIASGYTPSEIVNAKVMVVSESNAVKMSIVGSNLSVDGVKGSRNAIGNVEMLVNARIVSVPERLRDSVQKAVNSTLKESGLSANIFKDDCFSPLRLAPFTV